MTKKKLMAIVSVFIAFTMTVAPAVTAFAEGVDATETVYEGDYNSVNVGGGFAAINVTDGKSVTVTGDAKATNTDSDSWAHPVIMNWEGTVSVGGDVIAKGPLYATGITDSGGDVVVGGIVDAPNGMEGVFASEDAMVMINNSNNDEVAVIGGMYGVTSIGGSLVGVQGSVIATGVREDDTLSSAAVHVDDSAAVIIMGDATSPEKGLEIEMNCSEKKGAIFIDGTVCGDVSSISLTQGGLMEVAPKLGELSKELPSITIWFLDGKNKLSMDSIFLQGLTGEEREKLFEEVYESIDYIIREDPDTEAASMYKLITDKELSGVKTVKKGQPLTVKAIDGYEITSVEAGAGSNQVTKNSDGTYTIITEYGGIALAVKVRRIVKEDTGEVTYEVVETTSSETPIVPVVSTGNSATANVGGTPISAISGEKAAKTVSLSMSSVTPVQYKNTIIDNVTSAPANGAFNIVTDTVACFDAKMIEAIAARPDIDVNVVFTYGGKKIKVVIPAGYDVKSLLDANGYCGFLRLLLLLGGTQL